MISILETMQAILGGFFKFVGLVDTCIAIASLVYLVYRTKKDKKEN